VADEPLAKAQKSEGVDAMIRGKRELAERLMTSGV
jgi:hypothetical protein